jgi:hypothetical protein
LLTPSGFIPKAPTSPEEPETPEIPNEPEVPETPETPETPDEDDTVDPNEDNSDNEENSDEDNSDNEEDSDEDNSDNEEDSDEDNSDNEEDSDEDNSDNEEAQKKIVVTQSYQNSMADGSGSMLWTISVSYDGKNAAELSEEDGLYLVYYISYGEEYGDWGWYAFETEFTVTVNEEGCTVLYGLPNMTKSVRFAIVKKAPSDSFLGGYADDELSESDFVSVSEVYYNSYFEE